MEISEQVEFLKELQKEVVEEIRRIEPDYAEPENGFDDPTMLFIAQKIDTWFADRIFDLESA